VLAAAAQGSAAEDFYKDKTIKIIVGSASGGAYDIHARLIAKVMGKHIPGNPNIVVQNMPAGGGMGATNHIFNTAAKDGTELGLFNRNSLFGPILGDNVAKYQLDRFNWIGTPASYSDNAWVFFINPQLPYKTFDEIRRANPPLNIASGSNIVIRVLEEGLGAKLKLIGGYAINETFIAYERQEIDGFGTGYTNILGQHPHWIEKNMVRFLAQFARTTRLPELADVPTGRELAQTPEDLALLEIAELPITLGFPVAAPPDVPADRVALLKEGFRKTMVDSEYRAEAAKAKTEYSPKYGDQLLADLKSLVTTPPSVIDRYRKLAAQEAEKGR
jgi:tripartite-type tricarboxylate transporter receptor subunit TctC